MVKRCNRRTFVQNLNPICVCDDMAKLVTVKYLIDDVFGLIMIEVVKQQKNREVISYMIVNNASRQSRINITQNMVN